MLNDHSLTVLEVVFLSIGTKPMVSLEALHICLYLFLWVQGKTTSRSVYKHSPKHVCVYAHICVHIMQFCNTVKLFYYYLQAYFMCWKYNVSTTFNVLFLLVALFGVISEHTNTMWQWHCFIQFGTRFCCRYGKLRLLLS